MTGKTIDNMTKCKIKAINEQNISMIKVEKHLHTTHATVSTIISRYHEYNAIENLSRPGRPSISNERNECLLIRIVKKRRKLCTDLSRKWQEASCGVASARTIRRVLQKHN